MIKTIEEAYLNGWKIKLDNQVKRMEVNGIRQHTVCFVYEASKVIDDKMYHAEHNWEGFKDRKECLENLLIKINEIEAKYGTESETT